jgi:hypothetical protein
MERAVARELVVACEQALESLTAAESAIGQIPASDERTQLLEALAGVIASVLGSIRAPAVRQYPDIVPAEPLPSEPDTGLDAYEQSVADRLSPADVERIDQALLAECSRKWRKVARVVGSSMAQLAKHYPELPDRFYARRIISLVEAGTLESEGNLDYMRFSEVRLPG